MTTKGVGTVFTAIIEGNLLGVTEGKLPDGAPLFTYLLNDGTEVLKLYGAGEGSDAIAADAAKVKVPARVRVQVQIRQDNQGKTKVRPLAFQPSA